MRENELDFSLPSVIEPGSQKGRMQVLYDLAEYIGSEFEVKIQPFDVLIAEDASTEPTFMYLFDAFRDEIWLVAHGVGFSRSIKPGNWDIDPIEVGNQIRDAIRSLQDEFDGQKTSARFMSAG